MSKYNNCVKVQFEIGHEASIRSEVTPQGFTHDWQVFVRGADNTEIHHFVDKVVFNLHHSFPKPKRVVKEPPYEVRESGYASFTFPIEVYLKTKDEPRKLDFVYDLSLNTSGPIRTSQREKRIFNNPSEEFRRKLIRGGGVGVGSESLPLTDNNSQNADDKSSSRKSSSDSTKKHKSKDSLKSEDVRSSNQFADLFGTPIKKLSPTTATKKTSESKHSSDTKVSSKSISKHSPHKEKEKDKESIKKDTMITSSSKEKDKERDRIKEKEKKPDKSLKRPPSPIAALPPAKTIKEEQKKSSHEDSKEKEKMKSSSSDVSKNEKKEKKKDKKSRDEKDKKDRHKDHESKKELPPAPPPPLPPPPVIEKEKEKLMEKTEKIKSEFKDLKENIKKSPKHIVKEDKFKEKIEKEKVDSVEKQRHKHRKKEKNKKEEKELKEKEKDKSTKKIEKLPPVPVVVPKEPSPPPQPPPVKSRVRSPSPKMSKTHPLSALMSELPSDKGSDSESSGDEDTKSVDKLKMTPPPAPLPPVAQTPERVKEFTKEKVKKKEKKSSSKDEDGPRKKKRKSKEKEEVVIPEKITKAMKADEDHKNTRDEQLEEDMDDRLSEPSIVGSPQREDQEISRSRSPTPPTKFTEEYVMELKDLQQKIMTLEDNAELQRVVQVIAETGQYEITKKTFDFDLCALDKSTVKRLQDLFFAAS